MIPFKYQMAMSWQNKAFKSVPLLSGFCARLGLTGIMLADTINQSEMQAARFHHNNIDVAMLKGNSSCGRPRTVNEDATPESGWSRARSASIARRLRVLCDKFESEEFGFERPLFDVNEGSRSHNQVVDAWFLRKLVRGWYGSCL